MISQLKETKLIKKYTCTSAIEQEPDIMPWSKTKTEQIKIYIQGVVIDKIFFLLNFLKNYSLPLYYFSCGGVQYT